MVFITFSLCPGAINTDETLRLIGGHVDGVKPLGKDEKLGSAAMKLRQD
jgi:hypothetical protein